MKHNLIDYAYPAMMAEEALKRVHNATLNRDWDSAKEQTLLALQWVTEVHSALLVMEQREA